MIDKVYSRANHKIAFKIIIMTWVLLACAFRGDNTDVNAKVKAIFLYNFSKYITWPEKMASGRFKIAIYGNYPALKDELVKMSRVKRRGDRSFEILSFDEVGDIVNTHILFVVKEKGKDIDAVTRKLKKSSTLVVTEGEGLINRGAHINLYYENNKQKLEVNLSNFVNRGLVISEELISISKVVDK